MGSGLLPADRARRWYIHTCLIGVLSVLSALPKPPKRPAERVDTFLTLLKTKITPNL
jgi:hypothetical protein